MSNSVNFIRIPLTNGKLCINHTGILIDGMGNLVPIQTDEVTNEPYIVFDWYNGKRRYKISELVLHAFNPIHIPLSLWDKLTVWYKDNDVTNVNLYNLVWKFPVGLTYPGTDDLAFIPDFTRYVISKSLEVFEHSTSKRRNGYDRNGYVSFSLVKDGSSNLAFIDRHRAMALAWMDYPIDYREQVVNHLNGVPGDDRIENLEWTDKEGDVNHAFDNGLIGTNKVINAKNLNTGELLTFRSIFKCSEALGITRHRIVDCLDYGYSGGTGYEFTYADPEKDSEKRPTFIHGPILARHTGTGEVLEFPTQEKCIEGLGIGRKTLLSRLNDPNQTVYTDEYQFQYKKNAVEWLNLASDASFEEMTRRKVLIRNVKTGEVTEYESKIECANALGITRDAVSWRLNQPNQPVFPDYNQYKLKSDRSPWRIPGNVELELLENSWINAVLVRDVVTNEVTEYSSQNDCGKALGLCDATVSVRVADKDQPVFPGNLQFKLKTDPAPWREVTDLAKELATRGGKRPVIVTNVNTGEVTEYATGKECSVAMGLLATTLNFKLKQPKVAVYNGYTFEYKYK